MTHRLAAATVAAVLLAAACGSDSTESLAAADNTVATTTTTAPVPSEEPDPTTVPPTPTTEPEQASTTTSAPATTTTVRPDEWTVDLPFYDPGEGGTAQAVYATLVGDPDVDGGCVWLDYGQGPETIEWVPGTKAHFFTRDDGTVTFELIDPHKGVVGVEGDQVVTGGPQRRPGRAERCNVGDSDTHIEVGGVSSK